MASDDGATLPAAHEAVRLNDMASSQEQLRTTLEEVKNWSDEHRPQLTQARIDELVQGPSFDEHWSQQDAAQSKLDWENDPMKPRLLSAKNNSKLGHP
ncbi:Alcohol acetyltransferase [Pestalotiopsis sp. IQ-011]